MGDNKLAQNLLSQVFYRGDMLFLSPINFIHHKRQLTVESMAKPKVSMQYKVQIKCFVNDSAIKSLNEYNFVVMRNINSGTSEETRVSIQTLVHCQQGPMTSELMSYLVHQ
jgi:hypothetical protein